MFFLGHPKCQDGSDDELDVVLGRRDYEVRPGARGRCKGCVRYIEEMKRTIDSYST